MKKNVTVKQKNLYTGDQNPMYKGVINYSYEPMRSTFEYREHGTDAKIKIIAEPHQLTIHREAEITSHLVLALGRKTMNTIMSEFGIIEIQIFTHKYIRKENIIAVEYDVLQGDEVMDGYRIIWDIKEETL